MQQIMVKQPTRDDAHWDAVEEAAELLVERRHGEALVLLRDAIKADPNNPYAYHHLGAAFYDMKNLEGARDAYRAALRLAPDYLGSRVGLSHVLRELGDPEAALAEAKEALRRFPKDGDALHASGLAYAALGKRTKAREKLEAYLGTNPELEATHEVRQILEMLGIGPDDEPIEFD